MTEHWHDWKTGFAKDLGVVWELVKGSHAARCVLQAHPLGTEAVVLIDGDIHRSEAFRDSKAMIDATADWRAAFEGKGWRPTS